jgi:hypothetical protein
MIDKNDFEPLLAANPSIEAVIRMGRDGLAQHSRSRSNAPVDEIVSIAAGLFSGSTGPGLLRPGPSARLFITAEHGCMYVRAEESGTLLLVLTDHEHTEQQLEAMLAAYEDGKGTSAARPAGIR